MSELVQLRVETDPLIEANPALGNAVRRASEYFRIGLEHIDTTSHTETSNPELRWSAEEPDTVKIEYSEEVDGLPRYRSTNRGVPVSQLLDEVGSRTWMLRLLQSVNRRRYDRVMERFERSIRELEEAEEHGR
jgi:hypothetical protein